MTSNQQILDKISKSVGKQYNVKIVAYPDETKRGYVNMEKIVANKQGEGNGTRALKEFAAACNRAGYKGITISVLPLSGFKTVTADDVDRLVRWYANNGFVLSRRSPIIQMERKF